jgi:cytoskeleton protein RodZ
MEGHEESEQSEGPGQGLAAARAVRGLSTSDVAGAINLRETVVKAIEQDDFTLCGGDVYARGHIRAYARQVGLDAAPLLAAYSRRTGWVPPAAPGAGSAPGAETTHQPAPEGARSPRRVLAVGGPGRSLEPRRPNWVLLGGAALAVVTVILGVQLIGELRGPARPSSSLSSLSPASPGSGSTSRRPSTSVEPDPTEQPGSPTRPAAGRPTVSGGVAVALRAVGDSWISVRNAKGRTVFSGTLTKGQARRFSDQKSLRLVLGNAGAVRLTVNGRVIGSAGRTGEVVELRFGPGDPA